MSDKIPPTEKSDPKKSTAEITPSTPLPKESAAETGSRFSITQLILAVLVAFLLWQWVEGQQSRKDMQLQLAQKIAEMGGGSKNNQVQLIQSKDQLRELTARITSLEAHYTELQNQSSTKEALYSELSLGRDETALAEIEQMLLLAQQQLQLSANVKAALIAVQSADARLQRMDRLEFNGLRKTFNQDMVKLRALPSIDITGINFQLNNLMEEVDAMPLAYQVHAKSAVILTLAPSADETRWEKLLREVKQEMGKLVRLENTGKAEIPLLLPNQEFFLRENLKLRLLSARIALLSRDQVSFRHELKTTQNWVMRYFDIKSGEGLRMQDTLNKLINSGIDIVLPNISQSLQAVRNYRLTREKILP